MFDKENSLLYWFPKIRNLGIPTPKTEIVEVTSQEIYPILDGDFSQLHKWREDEITAACKKIKYPLFMRTDEFSAKHSWQNTCYIEKKEDLRKHIYNLIEENECTTGIIGLPVRALVFREYIPMKNLFTAFRGNMPVNPELRFFIKNKDVLCHHWYWIEDAIEIGSGEKQLPDNWKKIIQQAKNNISLDDIELLSKYSKKVSSNIDGFWSIDFCLSKNNEWILIDMALGKSSWHPEDCHIYKKI